MHFCSVRNEAGQVLRSGYCQVEADILAQAVNPGETAREEAELIPVYRAPRVITVATVKSHAGRLLSYTDWVVVKALDTGEPADPEIIAKRQAIREASDAIEAMSPIPADFTDPKYWP